MAMTLRLSDVRDCVLFGRAKGWTCRDGTKATIFLFLGLRISWPEKRVGRSEKKKKKKIPNN